MRACILLQWNTEMIKPYFLPSASIFSIVFEDRIYPSSPYSHMSLHRSLSNIAAHKSPSPSSPLAQGITSILHCPDLRNLFQFCTTSPLPTQQEEGSVGKDELHRNHHHHDHDHLQQNHQHIVFKLSPEYAHMWFSANS